MNRSAGFAVLASSILILNFVPGPAQAAVTGMTTGDNLQYYGEDLVNDSLTVDCAAGEVTPAPAPVTLCTAIASLYVNLNSEVDTVDLSAVTAAKFPALKSIQTVLSDSFADTYTGSPLPDRVQADDDDQIATGAGEDFVQGGSTVDTGTGDDFVLGQSGPGAVTTGAGDDTVIDSLSGSYDGGTGTDTFSVDFSRAAGNLTEPTDANFQLTDFGLVVSIPAMSLEATRILTNFESVDIRLLERGTQVFDGSGFSGALAIQGVGGPDTLTGGKAADFLSGGNGADTVFANGGGADLIDCGSGTDSATVDPSDQVINCEQVTLVAPPTVPAGGAPSTSAVKGPKAIAKGKTAKFTFTGTGTGFVCKVDKQKAKPCASPTKVKTKSLKPGKHKLTVTATAPGTSDPTPSVKKFKVTGK